MFTVIKILPRESGPKARLKEILVPNKPQKHYVTVKGGTPFLIYTIKEEKHGINWNNISLSLHDNERTVLTDADVQVPPSYGLEKFCGVRLPMAMMFNNFSEIMKSAGKPAEKKVSIFDRDGCLSDSIEKIIMLVSQITVYTSEIRKYFFSAQKIMETYGASIRIYDYDSEKKAEKIIIADRYDYLRMGDAKIAFCAEADIVYDNVVLGNGIALDDEYLSLKPHNIDTLKFACALYECSALKKLQNEKFSKLLCFDKDIAAHEIVEKLS